MKTTLPILIAVVAGLCHILGSSVRADMLTQNSLTPSSNAATRDAWLLDAGITTPHYTVDFELIPDGTNISGVTGLFPAGLVITDTSSAGAAIVRSTGFGGSNPVGTVSLYQNEKPYLQLDFSDYPVDYFAFQDIDHAGTAIYVTFTDDSSTSFTIETTNTSGNSAEFVGMARNDQPRIALVRFDASGDGQWGIDTLEYGRVPSLQADFNDDGIVDVSDLGILATNWQTSNDHAHGDANLDTLVDVSDLGILATEWQQTAPASSTIPEPASLSFLAILLTAATHRRTTPHYS